MSSFEHREGRRIPAERLSFKTIIAGRLSELAMSRAGLVENVPAEHREEADSMPEVCKIDARMAYLRELDVLIGAFEGRFDASEKIVNHISSELIKIGKVLEDLAGSQQPYGYSPNEDPSDLLAIQLDLIAILETYAQI